MRGTAIGRRREPAFFSKYLGRGALQRRVMKRVLNRVVLVKVHRLQASILVADVKGSVNWVKRKGDGVSWQEEISQDMTGPIVPSNGSIVLGCRDCDIVSTSAVSH
jgi:hypothetical protein